MLQLCFTVVLFFGLLSKCLSGLSLYATYHNIGITVTGASGSTCSVYYCEDGGLCFDGDPLTLSSDRLPSVLYGSIFWLSEGTTYHVHVFCPGLISSDTITTKVSRTTPLTYANTLYVSPSGSTDPATCGATLPTACSVRTGLEEVLTDNTEVRFASGVYYDSVSDVRVTASHILLTRADLGPSSGPGDVVIDGGTTPVSESRWSPTGGPGNVFQLTLGAGEETSFTLVIRFSKSDPSDKQRLLRYVDQTDFQNWIYELDGFMVVGNTLFISLEAGTSYEDYDWVYGSLSTGIMFGQIGGDEAISTDVEVRGITFRHYGAGSYPKALYFTSTNRALVSGCVFDHNDRSIGIKYATNEMTIEHNEFFDSRFAMSWTGVKSGANEMEGGALALYASDPLPARGLVIRRNVIHDYFDCLAAAPNVDGDQYGSGRTPSNEIDVYENHIYRCGDDSMELDGLAANSRVYDNVIEEVLVGISMAPAIIGPTYIFNNVIRGMGFGKQTHTTYTGMGFKFNVGSEYDSGKMFVWHNVVIADHPGCDCTAHGLTPTEQVWDDIILRNNILIGEDFAWSVGFNANSPGKHLDFDYDGLLSLEPDELAWWAGMDQRHLTSIEMVRNDGNQEHHGIDMADFYPRPARQPFVDATIFKNENYTLVDDSPLRGSAQLLPGVNDGLGYLPHIGLVHPIGVPFVRTGSPSRLLAATIVGYVSAAVAAVVFVVVLLILIVVILIGSCKKGADEQGDSKRKTKKKKGKKP